MMADGIPGRIDHVNGDIVLHAVLLATMIDTYRNRAIRFFRSFVEIGVNGFFPLGYQ